MVDTTDLKSVDLISREGSSPSTPKLKELNGNIIAPRKRMYISGGFNFLRRERGDE